MPAGAVEDLAPEVQVEPSIFSQTHAGGSVPATAIDPIGVVVPYSWLKEASGQP